MDKNKVDLGDLVELMARLRSEGGCPWDREQTPESLTPYVLEEAHEVVEAVREGDPRHVCEELGDLLFQIVFQARIGEERGDFDMGDVIASIHEKMTRRHPHVFGDARADDSEQVRKNWVRIKEEQEGRKKIESVLGKVPKSFPALLRARRLTENAREVGFDWDSWHDVMVKFEEEWDELRRALDEGDKSGIEDEFGDVLFVLVNLARFIGVDPEQALHRATDKFVRRFQYLEGRARDDGRKLEAMTLSEMEAYWDEAKRKGV